jgi:TcpE family
MAGEAGVTDPAAGPALTQRSFTFGRRYPKVIGRIGRFTLPAPMSVLQLGVFVGGVGMLRALQPVWAHLGALNVAVYLVVPAGLAFAARFARVEGRSPARFLLGVTSLALTPHGGYLRGRAVAAVRPWRLSGAAFTDPGPPPAPASGSPRAATESPRPAAPHVAARPSVADLQAALAPSRAGRLRGAAAGDRAG